MSKYSCGNEVVLGDVVERVCVHFTDIKVGERATVSEIRSDRDIVLFGKRVGYDPKYFKLISRKTENKFAVKFLDGTMSNLTKEDALAQAEKSGVDCVVYEMVPRYEFKAVKVTTTKMECTEIK